MAPSGQLGTSRGRANDPKWPVGSRYGRCATYSTGSTCSTGSAAESALGWRRVASWVRFRGAVTCRSGRSGLDTVAARPARPTRPAAPPIERSGGAEWPVGRVSGARKRPEVATRVSIRSLRDLLDRQRMLDRQLGSACSTGARRDRCDRQPATGRQDERGRDGPTVLSNGCGGWIVLLGGRAAGRARANGRPR